jgi:hypothetical protein
LQERIDASLKSTQEAHDSFVEGTQHIIRAGQQAITVFTAAGAHQVRAVFTQLYFFFFLILKI